MGLFEKRHRNNSFAFGTSGLAALVVSSSMDFDIGIRTRVERYSNYYYHYQKKSVKRPEMRQNALPRFFRRNKKQKKNL